jgi:hypothetical protein
MADRPIPPIGHEEWATIYHRWGLEVAGDVQQIHDYATRFANREARMYEINRLERAAWMPKHRGFTEFQLKRQRALSIWRLRWQLDHCC